MLVTLILTSRWAEHHYYPYLQGRTPRPRDLSNPSQLEYNFNFLPSSYIYLCILILNLHLVLASGSWYSSHNGFPSQVHQTQSHLRTFTLALLSAWDTFTSWLKAISFLPFSSNIIFAKRPFLTTSGKLASSLPGHYQVLHFTLKCTFPENNALVCFLHHYSQCQEFCLAYTGS